jgi:hypothetical protein
MEELLSWLNPLSYVTEESYLAWWDVLSDVLLRGVPLRLATVGAFAATFWFGVYKQRVAIGIAFFLLALLLAYVHPFAQLIRLG